jgi:hypothetical protein
VVANQEKSYQQRCGQRCQTNISPAVSLSKKKGALIGRAAGEQYRPLKKLNQVCDPSDNCGQRGEVAGPVQKCTAKACAKCTMFFDSEREMGNDVRVRVSR